ncbi:MAG TPA: hypothetical protein DD435_14310, partial [Cyanobacteria bacterium UBA8530]|nr:hypothetical protein [Cyanobacteria bacterium UBA8530]
MEKNKPIFKQIYVRFFLFFRYERNHGIAALGLAFLLLLGGSPPWASPYPLCPGVSFVQEKKMKILLVDPSRVEILPVVSSPKSLL